MADVELSEGRPRGLFNILDDEGNAHRDLRAGIYACARRFLKFTPIASPPSDHAPTAQELMG
jgi:hypothetical protein